MIKNNKHIEIVRSSISQLSSLSQASCDSMLAVLAKHYSEVGVTVVNNVSDLEALVALKPDLVFIGMEFIPSNPLLGIDDPEKIWLTKYLDEHDIAYTGSNYLAHSLGRNKALAKQRILESGLKTPSFFVLGQGQSLTEDDVNLEFPLFVKPTNRGGGLGIDNDSIVYNYEQLQRKTSTITNNLRSDSLIEEYLDGREFSVAILKDDQSMEFLALPIELIAPPNANGARILSGKVKSLDRESAVAVTDEIIKAKVNNLAVNVFQALGAHDYGRIDIRLDKEGQPFFLEANLIPSLISGYGSFPKACVLNMGLDYEDMIIKIARLGFDKVNNIEEVSQPMMTDADFIAARAVLELA